MAATAVTLARTIKAVDRPGAAERETGMNLRRLIPVVGRLEARFEAGSRSPARSADVRRTSRLCAGRRPAVPSRDHPPHVIGEAMSRAVATLKPRYLLTTISEETERIEREIFSPQA